MPIKIQSFGLGEEVLETSKESLGGKGAGLVWMTSQGFPVPPGFVITTEAWAQYAKAPKGTMKAIGVAIKPYLKKLAQHLGYMPLLAVRSGARVSCPGMMDTILNVGLDSETIGLWNDKLGTAAAEDSNRRLITMYGHTVKGLNKEALEAGSLMDAAVYYTEQTGEPFPLTTEQILGSIEAVLKSWTSERAKTYRALKGYKEEWGTAVVVQAMVFGNLNDLSCTGVLFTRDCDTGVNEFRGEFLLKAQGEDVVAGTHTPKPLNDMKAVLPMALADLMIHSAKLEQLKKDVQDVEFTVQDGTVYILQTRSAQRTALAALKIATDFFESGVIDEQEYLQRITARDIDNSKRVVIDPAFKEEATYTGIGASQGIVSGRPVFDSAEAIASQAAGVPCILITTETTPEDIGGMVAARGIITMKGGLTSHAAVVARGMNKPCVTALNVKVNQFKGVDCVSLCGATGRVWRTQVPTLHAEPTETLKSIQSQVYAKAAARPVLFAAPNEAMDEALLVLPATSLFNPEAACELVADTAAKVVHLYVDVDSDIAANEAMLCIYVAPDRLGELRFDLLDRLGIVGAGSNVTLVCGDVGEWSGPHIRRVTTLENLILANEVVVGKGNSFNFNTPTAKKVLQWRGTEITRIALGDKVKGADKTFLTFEKALQELQTTSA